MCFGRSRRRGKAEHPEPGPRPHPARPPGLQPSWAGGWARVGGHVWEGLEMGREGWLNQVSEATYSCHGVLIYVTGSQGCWENL